MLCFSCCMCYAVFYLCVAPVFCLLCCLFVLLLPDRSLHDWPVGEPRVYVQVLEETPLEPKALTMAGRIALHRREYLVCVYVCMVE